MRRAFVFFVLVTTAGLGWAAPARAQATRVRVIAPDAIVRTSPDAAGQVIVTATAGTVLDAVARAGEWHEVLLPAAADGVRRRGFIEARFVEALAPPVPAVSRGPAAPAVGGAAVPLATKAGAVAADWQARYDRAIGRKRAGRTKVWSGLPVLVVGLGLDYYSVFRMLADGDDDMSRLWTLQGTGIGLVVGGGLVARSGHRDIRGANEELLLLERERAQPPAARLEHFLGDVGPLRVAVSFVAGRRSAALVRVGF